MFNDNYFDYTVKINGKDFYINLNMDEQRLYSWESAALHLAEGAGGSVSFKEFQESEGWQNFIKKTYGNKTYKEILQKIIKALSKN